MSELSESDRNLLLAEMAALHRQMETLLDTMITAETVILECNRRIDTLTATVDQQQTVLKGLNIGYPATTFSEYLYQ